MSSYVQKPHEVERKWYLVDATDKTLGRLSSKIASILRGKHKPIFTPHVDCGDYVVVINAEKVKVTGKKLADKEYKRHSGYPGGLKTVTLEKMLEASDNKENVKKQFYRVANSPNGLYPLIDYVNFKGEGTNPKERYNGQGWGLLQVLENMKGTETGKAALTEFSNSAKFVLQRRVNNSDPSKNERKWLQGWFNRCNTYAE